MKKKDLILKLIYCANSVQLRFTLLPLYIHTIFMFIFNIPFSQNNIYTYVSTFEVLNQINPVRL
jgi:hypothetical protein